MNGHALEPSATHNPCFLWHITLFGTLEVRKPSGEIVPMQGRKAGELLAYLALFPEQ